MVMLPDYDAALALVLHGVTPLDEESVALDEADRHVLAETITADRDLPPFNRAMMDGYALRSTEIRPGASWPVSAVIPAGRPASIDVPPGTCVKIATGAPVPSALDVVIPHEQTDRGDPLRITLDPAAIQPGHAIHPRGSDARAGAVLLTPGTPLGPAQLGILASVGCARVRVHRQPRTVILTSGDEVRPVDGTVADHQIRNSNAPLLRSVLRRFGARVVRHEHVADEEHLTTDALRRALEEADLVITVGGVSAGERDHFPAAFATLDVHITLHGAAIQPGKPIRVGRAPSGRFIAALPGNPVSVLATAHLFVWPLIRVLRGFREVRGLPPALPWEARELAEDVRPNPHRRAFRPAELLDDGRVRVPSWAGSGDLVHTRITHGLLNLPPQSEPLRAGERRPFLPWA